MSDLDRETAIYAALCAQAVVGVPNENIIEYCQILANRYFPLDLCAIIQNELAPMVAAHQATLANACRAGLSEEATNAKLIKMRERKPLRWFVGLAFRHAKYNYLGCIVGWDVSASS
jgi:F-box protein 21